MVAFSSGNHAQAVALAAGEAGVRAVVAMPDDAPKSKVAATRAYGAEIVFYDRHGEDREAVAHAIAEREHLVMVPPYDDYLIMAGQGTSALEFLGRCARSRLHFGSLQRRRAFCGSEHGGERDQA